MPCLALLSLIFSSNSSAQFVAYDDTNYYLSQLHQQNIYYQIDGNNEGFNQNSRELELTLGEICRKKAREKWLECTKRVSGVLLNYTLSNSVMAYGATLMLTGVGSAVGSTIVAYGAIMTGIGAYYHSIETKRCDVEKENMIDGGACPS